MVLNREEMFIANICGESYDLPAPQTRNELLLKSILDGDETTLSPVTRIELYLASISGKDVGDLPQPRTRIEMYLAAIAGIEIEPPIPLTSLEQWLASWYESGGSGEEFTTEFLPIVSIMDALAKPAKAVVAKMEPIQDLHGYDAPWPAGGGKNLMSLPNTTFVQYYEVEIDEIPSGTYVYSGVVTSTDTDSNYCSIIFLDKDKNTLAAKSMNRSVDGARVSTSVFTVSVPIKYVRLYASGGYSSGEGDTANFNDNMIETGDTASAYAPYENLCPISGRTGVTVYHSGADTSDPQTYPVVFPDSVGTVYGGTVDVVTGALTVTHGIRTLYETDSWSLGAYDNFRLSVSGMAHIDADVSGLYCTALKPIAFSNRGSVAVPCVMGADSNNIEIRSLSTLGITTVDELKTWLADMVTAGNPVGIVYPLAEPQTYQLTPTQIQLLKGVNVLWSDANAVQVTYLKKRDS